jgi:hypothetical protein
MEERVYKTMKSAGVSNLIMGIVIMLAGIGIGVMVVINGARLLQRKSDLLF